LLPRRPTPHIRARTGLIAFVRTVDGHSHLFTISLTEPASSSSRSPRTRTTTLRTGRPTGRRSLSTGDLAFVRCCPPGWDGSIYVRRAGSDTAERFVGRRDNGEGSDSAYNPDWSPDGSTLAYTDFGDYSDGGDSLILTTTDGTTYGGFDIPCDYCDPSDPA
jgi:hypothetical protein